MTYVNQEPTPQTEDTAKHVQSTKSPSLQEPANAFLAKPVPNQTATKMPACTVTQESSQQQTEPVRNVHQITTPPMLDLIAATHVHAV